MTIHSYITHKKNEQLILIIVEYLAVDGYLYSRQYYYSGNETARMGIIIYGVLVTDGPLYFQFYGRAQFGFIPE